MTIPTHVALYCYYQGSSASSRGGGGGGGGPSCSLAETGEEVCGVNW